MASLHIMNLYGADGSIEPGVSRLGANKPRMREQWNMLNRVLYILGVHKECHAAIFNDFRPPSFPCHKLSKILDPPP